MARVRYSKILMIFEIWKKSKSLRFIRANLTYKAFWIIKAVRNEKEEREIGAYENSCVIEDKIIHCAIAQKLYILILCYPRFALINKQVYECYAYETAFHFLIFLP